MGSRCLLLCVVFGACVPGTEESFSALEAPTVAQPPADECAPRRAYAEARLKEKTTENFLAPILKAWPEKGHLLLGESHYLDDEDHWVPFLKALKKARPSMDCLFLEGPATAQPELEAYLSGKEDFYAVVDVTGRISKTLADVGQELGLKVMAVDEDMPLSYLVFPENMHRRNIAMGVRIAASACTSGVLITGLWHLAPAGSYDSIQEVLERNIRGYATVLVEHANEAFDRKTFDRPAGATFDRPDVCDWTFDRAQYAGSWSVAIPKNDRTIWQYEQIGKMSYAAVPWNSFDVYQLLQ